MAYVQWPPLPAYSAVIASDDVYLNTTTPLTVIGSGGTGGGTPPSSAPTAPTTGATPTQTSINIVFSTAGISGSAPITYGARYSTTSTGPWTTLTVTYDPGKQIGQATANGLTINTTYYFQSSASNAYGTLYSASSPIATLAPGVPPGNVPNPELLIATSASIDLYVDTAAVTGDVPIYYTGRYGTISGAFTDNISYSISSGTIYTGSLTAPPNTTYYFETIAENAYGTVSTIAPYPAFSTTNGGGTPPGNVPNAELLSATTDTIDLYIDTAGVSGNTPITYTGVFGLTPGGWTNNLYYTLSSGTIYTATVPALPSSTTYYFGTLAQNTFGITSTIAPYPAFSTTGGTPPPPVTIANVSTNIGVGFLTFGTGGFSSIILDTSQNVNVGNWQADGVITYSGTPPGGISGPQYLSTQQGAGSKIILSLGGASDGPTTLSTMFGLESGGSYDVGAENLANSLAYAYFGGSGDNPLGFAKTEFEGFAFDGIDLDIEAVTPSTTTLQVFLSTLKGNPAFAGKIVTAAPQTPYLTQATTSGLNANNTFTSFSAMNPATVLNEVYTGNAGNQLSVLSPTSGGLIDYHFIQCYNNASYSYPTGATNGNWNNVVAAWGIQSLQCGYSDSKPYPKNIYAFATTDGNPLWDPVGDASAFNASLVTANSTIRGFSTTSGVLPYSSVTIADWCVGIGYWAANTNVSSGSSSLPVLSTMYGQPSTLNNMPTDTCMTYGGVFNSSSWGLTGLIPIPNARGY